jgi:predicted O-linked N-acetylglucosamine transferase (SPINDLY family)
VAAFREALDDSPEDFDTLTGYGGALLACGQFQEAMAAFERARSIDPGAVEPLQGIARVWLQKGDLDVARVVCEIAVDKDPENIRTQRLLGEIYFAKKKDERSRQVWENVLRLAPDDGEAHAHVTLICWALGDLEGTIGHARAAVASGRASHAIHSFFLYLLLYRESETADSIKAACEKFGRSLNPKGKAEWTSSGSEIVERRLRIGYLSGEFTDGPAFYFLSSLIGNHDPEAVEVFCYHTRPKFDAATEWYRSVAANWRDCPGLGSDAIADRVREDGIDILVDLSGFFPNNALQVFARRAAPVQAAFPNCPITTGIANIDYIFTDRWTCRPGCESQYTEEAVMLPSGYLMYSPPNDAPPVNALPASYRKKITFGLFQRRPKMNTAVWDTIAEILARVPDSGLVIQNADVTLDDPESAAHQELVREFSARGVASDRLSLFGGRSHRTALKLMASADIALDTFPYQGQTTTCECLWMGVPVVTLKGAHHAACVGSSILERTGLERLVANSREEYVRIAVDLAGDLDHLSGLRAGMRERLERSYLLDGTRLASEVESAYRQMWTRWFSTKQKSTGLEG